MLLLLTVGFVSGLGQSLSKLKNSSSSKTPVHTHRRSKSVKAELMRNKVKYNLEDHGLDKRSGNWMYCISLLLLLNDVLYVWSMYETKQ